MSAALGLVWRGLACLTLVGILPAGTAGAADPDEIQRILREAKAKAVTVPGQVGALVALAWPGEADPDPRVQAAARRSLVRYGHHALPVLRRTIPELPPLYQGDAVAAFIESRYRNPQGIPPDYLPGLEESIWYGSTEAQRIALNEIQRYTFPPAVLSSIDAVYENPILTRYVVASLGRMRDPRARLFLTDLLLEGSDLYKGAAARALEHFGERTLGELRSGVLADDASARASALRVFLPQSEVLDLTLLKDYLQQYPEDDPELRSAVQKRVEVLERRLGP